MVSGASECELALCCLNEFSGSCSACGPACKAVGQNIILSRLSFPEALHSELSLLKLVVQGLHLILGSVLGED